MSHPPLRARVRLLTGVLLAGTASLAADCNRPARAPFLCCIQQCSGGLVTSKKAAPGRDDAGWACLQGLPIDFNGTCTAEEGVDCNQDNPLSTDGTGSGLHSSSGASSAGSGASSSASSNSAS